MNREDSLKVGDSPLLKLDGIYAKLECTNPTGSIKDRMVKFILDESEKSGVLRKDMTIVEATSGNTGISLSFFGKQMGYKVRIIMPEIVTEERKALIKSFGAELILSPAEGSFIEALRIRDEMVEKEHCFTTDQFSSRLNIECHYRTTGLEIIRQLRSESVTPGAFAAGVGTGGTLMGIAHALREVNPNLYAAAVEPEESPVMSGGTAGPHDIGGIGDGFIPTIVKTETGELDPGINEIIRVTSKDAMKASMDLANKFGYCVGVSSGANYLAAKKLANQFTAVVTVFPDGFTRYISRGLHPSMKCAFHGEACRAAREALLSAQARRE